MTSSHMAMSIYIAVQIRVKGKEWRGRIYQQDLMKRPNLNLQCGNDVAISMVKLVEWLAP